MISEILENRAEYLNGLSKREFSINEVKAISVAIAKERRDRDSNNIIIQGNTVKGRQAINERVAYIVNQMLKTKDAIKPADVRLYKKCRAEAYMDRTGRCAWGFANVREKGGEEFE